ncbi:MAG: hypothetical protein Q9160_005512 [Pyrenula sp. 1 TL-2023]
MAHAYKSLTERPGHDTSDEDDTGNTSEESSVTLGRDDSPILELPLELRTRVLMLTSRGVSHRHRHLLGDLHALLPHTFKDTKLDTKSSNNYNSTLNSLADLHSCNYVFFLEARKRGQDLYLWLARVPNGPTAKFSVTNIHTMGELNLGGNCLKGGRGIVAFDNSFDETLPHGQEYKGVVRELLKGIFCVPKAGVKGLKPFVDRIIGVFGIDGRIWIRVYEIREEQDNTVDKGGDNIRLVEVGPRFVLTPIVILEGSFGGPVIYENKEFVSPNEVRSKRRMEKTIKHRERQKSASRRDAFKADQSAGRPRSVLDNNILFQ